MKVKISRLVLVAALGVATAGTSYAHVDNSETANYHWLSHLADSASASLANQPSPFGYAATKNADRELSLSGGAKYLNVTRLETVRIHFGGNSLTWTFDTFGTTPFPLDWIIPGAAGITVFVAENPAGQGG